MFCFFPFCYQEHQTNIAATLEVQQSSTYDVSTIPQKKKKNHPKQEQKTGRMIRGHRILYWEGGGGGTVAQLVEGSSQTQEIWVSRPARDKDFQSLVWDAQNTLDMGQVMLIRMGY